MSNFNIQHFTNRMTAFDDLLDLLKKNNINLSTNIAVGDCPSGTYLAGNTNFGSTGHPVTPVCYPVDKSYLKGNAHTKNILDCGSDSLLQSVSVTKSTGTVTCQPLISNAFKTDPVCGGDASNFSTKLEAKTITEQSNCAGELRDTQPNLVNWLSTGVKAPVSPAVKMIDTMQRSANSDCKIDACPPGWASVNFDSKAQCQAPSEYKGPCRDGSDNSIFAHFEEYDPAKLKGWAQSCNVKWPACERVVVDPARSTGTSCQASDCPPGWAPVTYNGMTQCRAPSTYTGSCRSEDPNGTYAHFDNRTPHEVKAWAKKCGVLWPACDSVVDPVRVVPIADVGKCVKTTCPDDWTPIVSYDRHHPEHNPNQCAAPPTYKGPCGRTARFQGQAKYSDPKQLQGWAKNCNVGWKACGVIPP